MIRLGRRELRVYTRVRSMATQTISNLQTEIDLHFAHKEYWIVKISCSVSLVAPSNQDQDNKWSKYDRWQSKCDLSHLISGGTKRICLQHILFRLVIFLLFTKSGWEGESMVRGAKCNKYEEFYHNNANWLARAISAVLHIAEQRAEELLSIKTVRYHRQPPSLAVSRGLEYKMLFLQRWAALVSQQSNDGGIVRRHITNYVAGAG